MDNFAAGEAFKYSFGPFGGVARGIYKSGSGQITFSSYKVHITSSKQTSAEMGYEVLAGSKDATALGEALPPEAGLPTDFSEYFKEKIEGDAEYRTSVVEQLERKIKHLGMQC